MSNTNELAKLVTDVLNENPNRALRTNVIFNKISNKGYETSRRSVVNCLKGLVFSNEVLQKGSAKNFTWQINSSRETFSAEVVERLTKELSELQLKYEKLQKEKATGVSEFHIIRGKKRKVINDLFHSKLPKVTMLAENRKNIMMYGPTGSGKTHLAKQVSEALELEFSSISCTSGMSESQVGGRLLPVGDNAKFEYIISGFLDRYENGGVMLLDEMDAADPNVLLFINTALSNGYTNVPNRPHCPVAERHKDFVCVAAVNTLGNGADRMYSGRNKLDSSTLDRFKIGQVYIDYDRSLERQLCPNQELLDVCWKYREKIMENRLERAMTTRFIIDACDMIEAGWSQKDVDEAFFAGWREDEVNKVKPRF